MSADTTTEAMSADHLGWTPHVVHQLNGGEPHIELPAEERVMARSGAFCRMRTPYLVYMPEKDRVLLLTFGDSWAGLTHSDDGGTTWSEVRCVHADAAGQPDIAQAQSLTYLGQGELILTATGQDEAWMWFSHDYGETWGDRAEMPLLSGARFSIWDPFFADRDPRTGRTSRVLAASGGLLLCSADQGRTWGEPRAIPEWVGHSEIALTRAQNGDLVAALRRHTPLRFRKLGKDHYSGLAVSVSKDDGATWSSPSLLYEFGRHHPGLARLESGDLVMSHVVRKGYPDTVDGEAQYGIEALVSHDHGQTWDLDHRYLLALWHDLRWQAPQSTSTVALADGALLTAYSRVLQGRAVVLVRWRVNPGPVNSDRRIAGAPPDSDLRNKLDPRPVPGARRARIRRSGNVAVAELGARVTASSADQDPNCLLDNGGYSHSVLTLRTLPARVEITWPQAQHIRAVRLQPGAPSLLSGPSPGGATTDCAPLDYRLQYRRGAQWADLVPPVTNAQRFEEWARTAPGLGPLDFQAVHEFAPVRTTAIQLLVTRSTDLGVRGGSGEEPVVPQEQRETILRGIEIMAAE